MKPYAFLFPGVEQGIALLPAVVPGVGESKLRVERKRQDHLQRAHVICRQLTVPSAVNRALEYRGCVVVEVPLEGAEVVAVTCTTMG